MLQMFSSKTILQHLDSTVHPFQEVVICSDCAASQFKLNLLLASITAELGRNGVHDLFATNHCNLSCLVDGIGGTIKRLVSHGVMSGKAEVITSSEFASRSLTEKGSIFCLKINKTLVKSHFKLNDDWDETSHG